MMEVLRVQRHDFLNHLQVISGLFQLKKYDQVMEYINKIVGELNQAGLVARLSSPEIAAEIMTAGLAAHHRGIELSTAVNSRLDKGLPAGMAVAEIIREMLSLAIRMAETAPGVPGQMNFIVNEQENHYVFRVSFRSQETVYDLALKSSMVFIEEAARKINGSMESGNSDDGMVVITLTVPAGGSAVAEAAAEAAAGN